jgi:hypothetical protein
LPVILIVAQVIEQVLGDAKRDDVSHQVAVDIAQAQILE